MNSTDSEKRGGSRLHHPLLVAYQSVDRFLSDFGTDVSETGVFVNTHRPLPVGTSVRLLLALPEAKDPLPIQGVVSRVVAPQGEGAPGMGIAFTDVSEEERARLHDVVARLQDTLEHAGE